MHNNPRVIVKALVKKNQDYPHIYVGSWSGIMYDNIFHTRCKFPETRKGLTLGHKHVALEREFGVNHGVGLFREGSMHT